MIKLEDNIVIVLDVSNYKSEYGKSVPFKAKVTDKYNDEIWVKSLDTGKEYDLYYDQILEALEIDQIIKLLNMNEYGNV